MHKKIGKNEMLFIFLFSGCLAWADGILSQFNIHWFNLKYMDNSTRKVFYLSVYIQNYYDMFSEWIYTPYQ